MSRATNNQYRFERGIASNLELNDLSNMVHMLLDSPTTCLNSMGPLNLTPLFNTTPVSVPVTLSLGSPPKVFAGAGMPLGGTRKIDSLMLVPPLANAGNPNEYFGNLVASTSIIGKAVTSRNPNKAFMMKLKVDPSTKVVQGCSTTTLGDADLSPTIQWSMVSQAVYESVGSVTLQANLSTASTLTTTVPYSVSGTASNPSDHGATSGTVTIASGALSAQVVFTVVNDTATEGAETVIFTLGTPTNATLGANVIHTVSIQESTVPTFSYKGVTTAYRAYGVDVVTAIIPAGVNIVKMSSLTTFAGASDPGWIDSEDWLSITAVINLSNSTSTGIYAQSFGMNSTFQSATFTWENRALGSQVVKTAGVDGTLNASPYGPSWSTPHPLISFNTATRVLTIDNLESGGSPGYRPRQAFLFEFY